MFWSVKDPEKVSDKALVEATLNYGDWEDVQELIKLMGREKVSRIFFRQIGGKRDNYDKKVKNYFKLYFKKHAPGNSN